MNEYRKVWVSKTGRVWHDVPSGRPLADWGPFAEAVIVPGDLPTAEWNFAMKRVEAGGNWGDHGDPPEYHESIARAHLAIAEYLRANPPADEEQVQAMAALVDEVRAPGIDPLDLARHLYLAGVRAPEVTK